MEVQKKMKLENETQRIEQAAGGDKTALEEVLCSVFNLSLRMLGLVPMRRTLRRKFSSR